MMPKYLLALCIFSALLSCSDDDFTERPTVPFPSEYYPDFFTYASDPEEYPVNDCINSVVFPNELNEFIRGNLVIGNILHDCDSCQGFYGNYDWKSRCDEKDNYSGRWSTVDLGATVSFDPTPEVQAPLHFTALNSSSGHWKLSYGVGEDVVTIYYKAIRN